MTNANAPADFREFVSEASFDATLDKLVQAILTAGMTVFARIDHAAAASVIGLSMPPTVVILYGNARAGTPVMLLAPRAALDLPLRVLVRRADDGRTVVAFHPIEALLQAAGVPVDVASRLAPAQGLLVNAIAA